MSPADPWLKGSGKIITYKEDFALGSCSGCAYRI
jgi:hypothetical protein